MSKAETTVLEQIHNLIAADMLKRLQEGNCEARGWAVIIKFLKDNNIDAALGSGEGQEDAFAELVARAQESIARSQ